MLALKDNGDEPGAKGGGASKHTAEAGVSKSSQVLHLGHPGAGGRQGPTRRASHARLRE